MDPANHTYIGALERLLDVSMAAVTQAEPSETLEASLRAALEALRDLAEKAPPDGHPSTEHLLEQFRYGHLQGNLRAVSRLFAMLAVDIARLSSGPELTVCLRKLLEAKDAGVRAYLDAHPSPPTVGEPAITHEVVPPHVAAIVDAACAWVNAVPHDNRTSAGLVDAVCAYEAEIEASA